MAKNIKGIVMIVVFLALWYAFKNAEFFTDLTGFARVAAIVGAAVVAFIVIDFIFERRSGKALIIYLIIIGAAALFVGISYALESLGASEDVMMVVWFAIPVGLIILTSKPVQKFIHDRRSSKVDD